MLAAAAGWLAGRAQRLLGDRSFLDRVVGGLYARRIDLPFVAALDADVRAACVSTGVAPPRLEEFFNPGTRAAQTAITLVR